MPNGEPQPSSYEQQRREAEALPSEVKRRNAERLQREAQAQAILMERMGVRGEDSDRLAWIEAYGEQVRQLFAHDERVRAHMANGDIEAATVVMLEQLQH